MRFKSFRYLIASAIIAYTFTQSDAFPTSMDNGVPAVLTGGPVPPVIVANLLANSDLVVLGLYKEAVAKPGVTTHLTLRADRVIKGHLPGPSQMIDLGERQTTRVLPARYGIFFLRGYAGKFSRTDWRTLCIVAVPPRFSSLPAASDPLSLIAASVAGVFTIPDALITDKDVGLNQGVTYVGSGPDSSLIPATGQDFPAGWEKPTQLRQAEEIYAAASQALSLIPLANKKPYLTQIASSTRGSLYGRLWAYAALAKAGDVLQVDDLTTYMLHPSAEAVATNDAIWSGFFGVAPSEQLAPFFSQLVVSTSEIIREGAVSQLTRMDSPIAMRAMEKILQVDNENLRAEAVRNICVRTGSCDPDQAGELAKPPHLQGIVDILHRWEASHP